jgi:hydroxymethylpyrimidine/phosphomethylpyrimidine kinase
MQGGEITAGSMPFSQNEMTAGVEASEVRTALTIAGSDSGGGAGIQADLKTMMAFGVFGMSAVTALTAQNTLGVQDSLPVSASFVEEQMDSVFQDMFPDAVKIGMIADIEQVSAISEKLREYGAEHIVIDPVMISTSGRRLMPEDAAELAQESLYPLAQLLTPNIPEAEYLADMRIFSDEDRKTAASVIFQALGCPVLIKGGHAAPEERDTGGVCGSETGEGDRKSVHDRYGREMEASGRSDDLLYDGENMIWLRGPRISCRNTHGTGCTLSSAIASGLARGRTLTESVCAAKRYIEGALRDGMDIGHGNGPLNHAWHGKAAFFPVSGRDTETSG